MNGYTGAAFVWQVRKNGYSSNDKSNDAYLDKRLLACDIFGHCRLFLATKASIFLRLRVNFDHSQLK